MKSPTNRVKKTQILHQVLLKNGSKPLCFSPECRRVLLFCLEVRCDTISSMKFIYIRTIVFIAVNNFLDWPRDEMSENGEKR